MQVLKKKNYSMSKSIQEVKAAIATAQTLLASVKTDFAKVIRDKSIPLDERWELFKNAPSEFKNHNQWIYDFTLKGMSSRFSLWQEYEVERHSHVDLIDIIGMVEHDVNAHNKGEELEYCFTEKLVKIPDIVIQMKEELLLGNMASFTYDW
jgi:hypothetical protein